MVDKVISIQSKLIYGYVGSNIAELAIQLHGLDVIAFPTVLLSVHTGHQPVYGDVISKKLFDDLIAGIESFNIIKDATCIVSGYVKTEEIMDSTVNFVKRHPDKTYICDPVMGDSDGLFIPEDMANCLIKKLIPICNILTPNHFEMEYILGSKINSLDTLLGLVRKNPLLENKIVVLTSSKLDNIPENQIETIIIKGGKAERIRSNKVNIDISGTGDLFAAILASQLTLGRDIVTAVKKAKEHISNILAYVVDNKLSEMNAASLVKHIKY